MTESDIELMAIEQLEGMGYTYVYGPEIESKEAILCEAISRSS
jgi:type I restriction enzyme R subunit